MKNYIQDGQVIDFLVTSNTVGGQAYYINDIVVVACLSVAATPAAPKRCPMLIYGVVELDKALGETFSQGQVLYWNDSLKKLTRNVTGNKRCGFSAEPASSTDANCRIYLYALS